MKSTSFIFVLFLFVLANTNLNAQFSARIATLSPTGVLSNFNPNSDDLVVGLQRSSTLINATFSGLAISKTGEKYYLTGQASLPNGTVKSIRVTLKATKRAIVLSNGAPLELCDSSQISTCNWVATASLY
jgi:hypothetical protein